MALWASELGGGGGSSGALSTDKTELEIAATIAAGTTFNTNASGAGYSFSGDAGWIETSSALFENNHQIQIEKNGTRLDKSSDIGWVNSRSFFLNAPCDNGDKIIIFRTQ